MLTSIVIEPINHILDGESWACRRLQIYSGKIIRIRILPLFDLNFSVQIDGKMIGISDDKRADAVITLTPAMFLPILANNKTAFNDIRISGDQVFAQELINISKHLRWDLGQDLSTIVGDILSHRLVQTGNNLVKWHQQSFYSLSQTLAEYYMEEQPVLASKTLVSEFSLSVDSLQLEVNELEKRISQLIG